MSKKKRKNLINYVLKIIKRNYLSKIIKRRQKIRNNHLKIKKNN